MPRPHGTSQPVLRLTVATGPDRFVDEPERSSTKGPIIPDGLVPALEGRAWGGGIDRDLDAFCEIVFDHLQHHDVSWLGFYRVSEDGQGMILAACRDRPACSPIGLHGVCGQSLRTGRTRVVRDVNELGADYVACDPRDRSEIVIPLRLPDGPVDGPWPANAVLDLDSFALGRFSDGDDGLLRRLLGIAGLGAIELGPPLHDVQGRSSE